MELIPGWTRHSKAISTWIAAIVVILDALYVFNDSLQSLLTPETFAALNAALVVAIKVANIIKQNIPVTPEVKEKMVDSALAAPTK